ncbi:MAG: hypothetical protein ACK4YP_13540 [Myxococcota bacterium]
MLFLLLAACGDDECVLVPTDVPDDVAPDGLSFTPADVVDRVTGTVTFEVRNAAEQWVYATLTVARGEGSAVHHDATVRKRFGSEDLPFHQDWSLSPPCDDEVHVPAGGLLVIDDEEVSLAYEGVAFTPSRSAPSVNGLGQVLLLAELPVATPGLPTPPEDATGVELLASYDEGVLSFLSLQWTGEVEGGLEVDPIVDSSVALQGT